MRRGPQRCGKCMSTRACESTHVSGAGGKRAPAGVRSWGWLHTRMRACNSAGERVRPCMHDHVHVHPGPCACPHTYTCVPPHCMGVLMHPGCPVPVAEHQDPLPCEAPPPSVLTCGDLPQPPFLPPPSPLRMEPGEGQFKQSGCPPAPAGDPGVQALGPLAAQGTQASCPPPSFPTNPPTENGVKRGKKWRRGKTN